MTENDCPFQERGQLRVNDLLAGWPPEDPSRLLLLYGLPGMGKTTLLREIERQAQERNINRSTWIPIYLMADESLTWQGLLDKAVGLPADYPHRSRVLAIGNRYAEAIPAPNEPQRGARAAETPPESGGPGAAAPETPAAEPKTWPGYFDALAEVAPDLTILFLLDDLDRVPDRQPDAAGQITIKQLLDLSRRPNVRVLATSTTTELPRHVTTGRYVFSRHRLPPLTEDDIWALVTKKLGDSDKWDPDAVAEEVFKWTGGIPDLACSFLDKYKKDRPKNQLPAAARQEWIDSDLRRWYTGRGETESVETALAQHKSTLKKLAAQDDVYTIDKKERPHEAASLDVLVGYGLARLVGGADSAIGHYAIAAQGLKLYLEEAAPRPRRFATIRRASFPIRLAWLSATAWLMSLVTVWLLVLFSKSPPLLGVFWMIAPFAYLVWGIFRPAHDRESL